MPLVEQVVEPFVQNDVAMPAQAYFRAMHFRQAPKLIVSVNSAKTHSLCQLSVKVCPDLQIRIRYSRLFSSKKVRQ